MIKKKIMLITLLLLAVLTIGAVSATYEADALAVDDAGDDELIEAPADEEVVETSVLDEDVVEADESDDILASPYAQFGNDLTSEYNTVCSVSDYSNGLNGTVTLFANATQIYSKEVIGEDYFYIMVKDLSGSFFGTYDMKVIYNGADGTNYEKEGTITFAKSFILKTFVPEDFNVSFPNKEIDIDKGNPVIITYFWPEGVKEHMSSIVVRYGDGEYDTRNFETNFDPEKDLVNVYKNITWEDLYLWDTGVFNITVFYCEDDKADLELGKFTLNVTENHIYTADDFMELYSKTISTTTDYVCIMSDKTESGLNGTVTIYANDTQVYSQLLATGNSAGVQIRANQLTATLNGVYNIRVVYKKANGEEYIKTEKITFIAPDTRPWVTFKPAADAVTYGQNAVVKVVAYDDYNTLDNTFSGNVLVELLYFNGIEYVTVASSGLTLTNGSGSATFSNLDVAEYLVILDANDTDAYKANPNSGSLTVKKALSRILFYDSVVEIGAGAPYNLTVDFDMATGITAKVDGENVTVDGNVVLIPALSFGNHTLEISTIPDDNHIEDSKNITLNVTKPRSSIIMDKQIVLYKGKSVDVNVTTKDAIGFNATIEGHPEALSVNGNVITISGLDKGTYYLSVTTLVDGDHVAVTEKATITVKILTSGMIFSNDTIVFDYGGSGSVDVVLTNATGFTASIKNYPNAVSIDGNKITVSGLDAGNYNLIVTTKPISGYLALQKTVKIIINPPAEKANSSVSLNPITFDYGGSRSADVALTNATGFTASIDKYPNTVSIDGNKITVSGLDAGTYNLTVTTVVDENHNAATKNVTVKVNQLKTKLIGAKVTTTYGTSKNLVITLKDANNNNISGKYVTVVLNKVTYKNKLTNSKGQISIAVPKNLVPKTYAATITFAGDKNYAKSTGSVNVVVNKAASKITAKAKTFKKSVKTKKYTVTLNVKQKVKVTLKVNKKTYTAYTNTKGQATFKITKLTKTGKHTATVSFGGNAYYIKAKPVNVKITVR